MNKSGKQFVLTKEGKLPRGKRFECSKYGIYAFLYKGKVIRFGESGSGFERIRKGFNHQLKRSNNKKNYHAYHFRKKYSGKTIEIRYYTSPSVSLSNPEVRRKIEAELAYQHRAKKGEWPIEMVEIHFSNKMSKSQSVFVKEILRDVGI